MLALPVPSSPILGYVQIVGQWDWRLGHGERRNASGSRRRGTRERGRLVKGEENSRNSTEREGGISSLETQFGSECSAQTAWGQLLERALGQGGGVPLGWYEQLYSPPAKGESSSPAVARVVCCCSGLRQQHNKATNPFACAQSAHLIVNP